MSNAKSRFVCTLALLVGVGLTCTTPAASAPRWVEEGPGPILNGQVAVPPNNPVSGAINAIAASRTNPDLVYVGTVNGGVWKTTNATAATPSWSPLTDRRLPGLSINSLAISPINPRILFGGTGSTSSFVFDGGPGFGIARSTDGGRTWGVLAENTFAGRRVNSIVPTALEGGNVVLAATLIDSPPGESGLATLVIPAGGVFRSTDMGDSFVRLSGNGSSGLPDQGVSSLVADPGNRNRFYAAVPAPIVGATGSEGVYRSDDGGMTWTAVNTGLTGLSSSARILLSVHNNALRGTNAVYAAVIANAFPQSLEVFRSDNLGTTWTALVDVPQVFPNGQGFIHGALAADPTDPNVVFIAGDAGGTWRGDASLLPDSWTLVDVGAIFSFPHVDSRRMVFDANGDLLQANDGGIYRLVDPNNRLDQRQWVSVNGDIRPTEFHSVAYDPLSGVVFGGTQDNGTPIQSAPGEFTWVELLGGDGGNVGVDTDQTSHPGTSIRYTSFQGFGAFNRTSWDATNTMVGGFTFPRLLITSGEGTGETLRTFDGNIQFYQPFVLNTIDPSRMLIGTTSIYESLDRGDTLANLGSTIFFFGNGLGASPIVYGGRLAGVPKPDVFYVGAGPAILHRVTLGGPIATLSSPGSPILGLVIDPQNYRHVFVLDTKSRVWGSFNEGASWTELTANLPALSSSIRVLEFVRPAVQGKPAVLLAGGLGGVFQLRHPQTPGAQWKPLTRQLPHGLVLDLHYDANDDVLVAGFLGRGAWTLSGFFGSSVAYVEAPQAEDETDVVEEQPRKPTGAAERLMQSLPPVPVASPPPVAVLPQELSAR